MSARAFPYNNRILASMPPEVAERVTPHLQLLPLEGVTVLSEPGDPQRHVYFPTRCAISIVRENSEGSSVEVALLGNEFVVGIRRALGLRPDPLVRWIAHCGDAVLQLDVELLRPEIPGCPALLQALLYALQYQLFQSFQISMCLRFHSVQQQLCRWLLRLLDLAAVKEICLTHEAISQMIGARRESITTASNKLQRLGAIDNARGHLTITDRAVLEAHVCECYALMREDNRMEPSANKYLRMDL